MKVTADIFDLPCDRAHLYETSSLGAAMIAAVGLGLYSDYTTAVEVMTQMDQRFEPDPPHARTYDQLYRRVYCRMYQRLQPLNRAIRAIASYMINDGQASPWWYR